MTSSVEHYPQNSFFLVANGATTELGSFEIVSGDLEIAHLRCFHKKSGAFSYGLTLVVSTSSGGPALATSDVFTFDNATTGQTTDNHLVDITFTFSTRYPMLTDETYFFRIESTGYTRDDDVSYLAYWCDWLEPIGPDNSGAARLALGVRR
jgi:hypothetical protein